MSIKPLHDRIAVKRVEEVKVTAGGIVLPGAAAEKPRRGHVVAIGTGKHLDSGVFREIQVAVGDEILFGAHAGGEVTIDGDTVIIMKEEEVLAIIR